MNNKPISPRACSIAAFARPLFIAVWAACFVANPSTATLPDGFPVTDGLSVYLDAESVATSGSRVTTMLDQSGNNNHAFEVGVTQPTRPVLVEGATPSGLDAVRFDGIGSFAEVEANPADFDGRSRTVFLVFRVNTLGDGRLLNSAYTIIDSWEPAHNQSINRHRTNDIALLSQGAFRPNVRNPFGDFIATQTPNGSVSEGAFYIGVQEWRDNGDIFARIRNVANETVSGDAIGGMAEPEGHLHTRIGAGSQVTSTRPEQFFNGDIAAVLIYNRDLSTSEREDVESYLYNTYLTVGGGSGSNGNPPVTNGLILHINAMNVVTDGNKVTQLVDLSGRNNDAVGRVHNPQPGLPRLISAATPSGQDAIHFDGIGSYADIPSNPEDFDGRATTTIAVFRPTHLATTEYVTTTAYSILDPSLSIGEQSGLRTRTNWIRAYRLGNRLLVSARTKSGGLVSATTNDGSMTPGEFYIATNQWRANGDIAAILRTGSGQRFEGVTSGADAEPSGHIGTRIGGSFGVGNPSLSPVDEFFEGDIAAFLVYNRELSIAEIGEVEDYLHAIYLGAGPDTEGPGDPPITEGLVLHLNGAHVVADVDGAVTELTDTSGRSNHAVASFYAEPREGGPTLITAATPSGRPSARFDGNLQYLEIGSSPEHFDGFGKTTMVVFSPAAFEGRIINSAYTELSPGFAPSARTRLAELNPGWSGGNALRAVSRSASGAFIAASTPDGSLSLNEYYLGVNLAKDNGDTVSILLNTANERFEGVVNADAPDPTGHLHTRIGAGSGFGNLNLDMMFNGEVAAVAIFNRELSAAELEQMEGFLYNRYLSSGSDGGYAAWISGFDIPANSQEPTDDASGDGVTNLVKYALGLDPTVSTRDGLPTISTEVDGGLSYLTISTPRNPDAHDVIYVVEGSKDLSEWSTESIAVDESDPNFLHARLSTPLEHEAKGFLRLRVFLQD